MKLPLACLGGAAALALAACAGQDTGPAGADVSNLPLQTPLLAGQAPIVPLEAAVHVGADVGAEANALTQVARHGDASVLFGSVRDGIGAGALTAYLEADAASLLSPEDEGTEGLLLRFGATPPTVRVADGTPPALIDETVRAVQAINAALPRDWQLRFSRDPAPAGAMEAADGEILIRFAPQEDWPPGPRRRTARRSGWRNRAPRS